MPATLTLRLRRTLIADDGRWRPFAAVVAAVCWGLAILLSASTASLFSRPAATAAVHPKTLTFSALTARPIVAGQLVPPACLIRLPGPRFVIGSTVTVRGCQTAVTP